MNRNRKHFSRRATIRMLAALPLAAAGCDVNLPGQSAPPRLFRLTPKSTFSEDLPTVGWQLVIEQPTAPAGLNTTRIALMRGQTELEFYARANWSDVAPNMVQTLIVESFENSGRIIAVGRESFGLRSDFVLKSELREFQAEYGGDTPIVRVHINARLVQMPRREIIAWRRIERTFPAAEDSLGAIVVAFDEALGKVFKELVEWVLTNGEANKERA